MLKRKIDIFLNEWKNSKNHKPLIVKGARQVGKTTSIREFAKKYKSFVEINFKLNPEYRSCFDNYNPVDIIKKISRLNPNFEFVPNDTLILFDEIQDYPDAITSFKFFCEQGFYDVIASGSLLGINYNKISSIPVGYKEEYEMKSLDFEEYLWSQGYREDFIEEIYSFLKELKPLSKLLFDILDEKYNEYILLGGMPEVVNSFVETKNYNEPFRIQSRIYKDYEDDIIKYVEGLDTAKVKNIYRSITPQLLKDNHKFQITKIAHGAKSRNYYGCHEWLKDAGIINICNNISNLDLPLELYKNEDYFRVYYSDHGLFMASLSEEDKKEILRNNNLNIYNGAVYESFVSEDLDKQGYNLYFYKNEDATIELDFVIRKENMIIPIEVKRNRGRATSLINCINDKNINISKGIKLTHQNIGYDKDIITMPYFLGFLLKRLMSEVDFSKI